MSAWLALWLLLALSGSAHAGPIVGAIVGAIGLTGFAGAIVSTAIGFGLSYVASLLIPKPGVPQVAGGVGGTKLDLRADSDVPRSLIVGRAVTAGSLIYANTYGKRGDTDNAHLIEIMALADHPCEGLVDVFIEGKRQTLTPATGDSAAEGSWADDYEQHCSIKFYDGTQSAADSVAVAALASATNRPWTNNMVGTGVTYVRLHEIFSQKILTSPLQFKFVVDGIHLYDPREDTTAGGSGSQRWGTPSTYAFTKNPAVIIYNILRGIYVNGDFFYGVEGTQAAQLPLDVWFAAMNVCDDSFTNKAGDSIAKYECGGEITVDTEPLDAIKEILKTCGGRFVEIGGIYKLYIDAPGLSVYNFTDDDLAANQASSFKPILGLENRINYVTGSYTSPTNWGTKVAAPRGDADREALDGRRLPADLTAPMVQDGPRMQRLMGQMLARATHERKHIVPLGPAAFHVEPGDVVKWNSTRNGYVNKLFVVDSVDYAPNCGVVLSITEINPNDYDWDASTQEDPETDGELLTTRPSPKVVSGFAATGISLPGDLHTNKPGIKVTWDDPEDEDATFVSWQIRRPTETDDVNAGNFPEASALSGVIAAALAPNTAYEVRAKFSSHSGYTGDWSLWIPVTTPDDRLGINDFDDALKEMVERVTTAATASVNDSLNQIANLVASLHADNVLDKDEITRNLLAKAGEISASFEEQIAVAIGPDSATAQLIDTLQAQIGDVVANTQARFIVGVTPRGALAAYQLRTVAENALAGITVVAKDDGQGGASGQVWIEADQFFIGKTGGTTFKALFIVDSGTGKVTLNGSFIASGSITASMLNVATLSAIAANIGTVTAGKIRDANSTMIIDLDNARIDIFGTA